MNTVDQLLLTPFSRLKEEEKMQVKSLGPDKPEIKLEQFTKERGKDYTRKFTSTWYTRKIWLTASTTKNSLFCFPCLLFGGEVPWTKTGVTDLKHLSEKIKKHEACKSHLDSSIKLAMFGRMNIASQLDDSYRIAIRNHNLEVDKNRYILSKLIDCVRFCGAFELALRGHDEQEGSSNKGIFRGLVDFVASLDSAMDTHLKSATVFKGTSKTIQNELLDCMLEVTREVIIQQLRSSEFVAIQADDTTDVSTQTQSVLVFRYIDASNKVVERFYCFNQLKDSSAHTIATTLLQELNNVFPETSDKKKVIAQSYDGASVMSGSSGGVQKKVRDVYPNAHYVHCYAHQLNLIMEQAVSRISKVKHFFAIVGGLPAFFSRSPKRTEVLLDIVSRRLPKVATTRWNFHIRTVTMIYDYREDLKKCFRAIESSGHFESVAVREAHGFIRTLEDREFLFFLFLFYDIMHQVDILYNQLQKRDIDALYVQNKTTDFVTQITRVRASVDNLDARLPVESTFSSHRTDLKVLVQVAKEVCDTIIVHAKERFEFTKHLVSATLLQSDHFDRHERSFSNQILNETIKAYPMLNKDKLNSELSIIYGRHEFRRATGAIPLFGLFVENNLQEPFSETMNLLKILITTPMTTAESERCFSTLKRIKTFLRNTMIETRLNKLAMLSMEKELIRDIPDFNKRTIEKFVTLKDRRAKFLYKK
ncbi:zinc finger MYM-type protein 1-like [Lissotriton helveticus]